jgi:hypothetical protein
VEEFYPPQVSAIKYYLNNNDKENYSERQDVNVTGKMEYKVIPDEILEDKE